VVNSGLGNGRVDNDTLALFSGTNDHPAEWKLFNDQWGNVRLEGASSDTHDDETDDEGSERVVGFGDDGWDCRDDKNDMS